VTVKRTGSEGRWADLPARTRFLAEAAFLVLVAAGAGLAGLSAVTIIVLMLIAWLLVALIERASSREKARLPESRIDETLVEEPTSAIEERPSRSHVRRVEPEPVILAEPEVVDPGPAPAVTKRPLSLLGLDVTEAPIPPEPEPEPEPVAIEEPPPPPTPQLPVPAGPPREWNLWDLERRAREQAGDALQDEEWSALFVHLRQFANAEGRLPMEFDGLVRESFADLIRAA
jgi:hypothetical protein